MSLAVKSACTLWCTGVAPEGHSFGIVVIACVAHPDGPAQALSTMHKTAVVSYQLTPLTLTCENTRELVGRDWRECAGGRACMFCLYKHTYTIHIYIHRISCILRIHTLKTDKRNTKNRKKCHTDLNVHGLPHISRIYTLKTNKETQKSYILLLRHGCTSLGSHASPVHAHSKQTR